MYDQFSDMSTTSSCATTDITNDVWWVTSTSSLSSQVSKSSYGFDQSIDLGVQVGPAANIPVAAAAATTVRAALVFGNSESSTTAVYEMNSGGPLYNVQVDYDIIATWTPEFMKACRDLSPGADQKGPNTTSILQFFHKFGTHGLEKASFGQECTSSLYMETGEMLSTYYKFRSEQSATNVSLLWWMASNSMSMSSEMFTSEDYGFQYSIANQRCHGELDTDSTCGSLMQGTGQDSPAIIAWTYKPIWEMDVPGLSDKARDDMLKVFVAVLDAAVSCMHNSCNGHGACAPNIDAWNMIELVSSSNLSMLFDGKRCFCFDDFPGTTPRRVLCEHRAFSRCCVLGGGLVVLAVVT